MIKVYEKKNALTIKHEYPKTPKPHEYVWGVGIVRWIKRSVLSSFSARAFAIVRRR